MLIYNTEQYANELRQIIDFNRYAKLIFSVGTQLNNRKDRFDKSDIIEQCLEVYSNGRLQWVDDIGRDHIDQLTGFALEYKFLSFGLVSEKGNAKKIVKVKLKNSLGSNKGTTITNPADYYMLGQENAVAIISAKDIEPFLVSVPDGIEANIPFEKLSFVFTPGDIYIDQTVSVSYKEEKRKMQRNLIESI